MGKSIIFHSVADSAIFGLKTGHATATHNNINSLINEALADGYHLVRIKIEDAKEPIFEALTQSKLPWHHAYDIVKYYPNPALFPINMPLEEGVAFVPYTGQNKELLYQLVSQCYAADPIGYYKTPGLEQLITKAQEAECLAQYITTYYGTREKPLWFVTQHKETVGFIANHIDYDKKLLEGVHAGILPEKRNKGLFTSIIRFNINHAQNIGMTHIESGARATNAASQHVFESEGIKGEGYETIVHLMPNPLI